MVELSGLNSKRHLKIPKPESYKRVQHEIEASSFVVSEIFQNHGTVYRFHHSVLLEFMFNKWSHCNHQGRPTIAGSVVTNVSLYGLAAGIARGGAPSARLSIYKACWFFLCSDADLLAAINDAMNDGVDIISAGNYFFPGTATNVAPWILTVAATSIDRQFESILHLGNSKFFKGRSINPLKMDMYYEIINASAAAAPGVFQLRMEGICTEATVTTSKESNSHLQGHQGGEKDILSHSCIHDQLLEQRLVIRSTPLHRKFMQNLSRNHFTGREGKNKRTSAKFTIHQATTGQSVLKSFRVSNLV